MAVSLRFNRVTQEAGCLGATDARVAKRRVWCVVVRETGLACLGECDGREHQHETTPARPKWQTPMGADVAKAFPNIGVRRPVTNLFQSAPRFERMMAARVNARLQRANR